MSMAVLSDSRDTQVVTPSRDDVRDDHQVPRAHNRICPVDGTRFSTSGRGRYCSQACRQQAYRLRHGASQATTDALVLQLERQRQLVAHTVYECSSCQERLLGEWRCPNCNLMCRRLGLGGRCSHCDELVVIVELVPEQEHLPAGRRSR
jgi:hypothetical protein